MTGTRSPEPQGNTPRFPPGIVGCFSSPCGTVTGMRLRLYQIWGPVAWYGGPSWAAPRCLRGECFTLAGARRRRARMARREKNTPDQYGIVGLHRRSKILGIRHRDEA